MSISPKKEIITLNLTVIKFSSPMVGESWTVIHILPKETVNTPSSISDYVKTMMLAPCHTEKSNYPSGYTIPELYIVPFQDYYIYQSYFEKKPEIMRLDTINQLPLIRHHKSYILDLTQKN